MSTSDLDEPHSALFEHLRDRLRESLDLAIRTLRDDQIAVSASVHTTRRCTKKVRALLKLAPAKLKEQSRRVRADLRQSRKALGPARDARVAFDLLSEHFSTQNLDPDDPPQLLSNLHRICDDIEARTRAQIFENVIAHLQSNAQQIADWPSQDLNPSELRERICAGYLEARKLRPRKSNKIDLDDLHGFRSALVDHYYQLDFFHHAETKRFAKHKARLKELRTQLGLYLDHCHLQTLAEQHSSQHVLSQAKDKNLNTGKILPRLIKEAREIFDPLSEEMLEIVQE